MNTKLLTGGGLALALVLLFAVNIVSETALRSARLDLTENKLYMLSQGTRNILSGLKEPVNLRLFLSERLATKLPGINPYATRVRELLDEYRRVAGGHLTLAVIDPEPFSEAEDQAVGYGLQGVPLQDRESAFYFGLVATGPTGEEAVIPFFLPEREGFVEYDITSLIHQVVNPKLKVVGLLSSLPMEGSPTHPALAGQPSDPWVVLEQMRQLFEVRDLPKDMESVPEEVDVLMLVHPKELSDQTLYAIDQFVLRGGRALVFVDPHPEIDDTARRMPGAPVGGSELDKLLSTWGLALEPAKVVGDRQLAERVRFNQGSRIAVTEYPVWMRLQPAQMNGQDIVTAKLGNVMLASPGRLSAKQGAGTQATPLLQTTRQAMEIEPMKLAFVTDPEGLLREYRPAGEPFMLAARVTGKVKSAFPEGPPPKGDTEGKAAQPEDKAGENKPQGSAQGEAQDDTQNKPQHLAESKDAVNLIVVADTDLLQDRFWVRARDLLGHSVVIPTAANGSLVINALDNLSGSNDLISVRSRGEFARPFTRVDELRTAAEQRFREKEQQLLARLQETEQRLVDLERGKKDSAVLLSEDQLREIERFRQEKVQIRKELRQVQHDLRSNIERLEAGVKFVNIGLMPLLITIAGVLVGLHRLRRRRARIVRPAAEPQGRPAAASA